MRRQGVAALMTCHRGSRKRADEVFLSKEREEGESTAVFQPRAVLRLVTCFCVDAVAPGSPLWVGEKHRCCCAMAAILEVHRLYSLPKLGLTKIVLLFGVIL